MERKQAMERFTREFAGVLSNPRADKATVKRLRQEYFEKNHLATAARFTNEEVADLLVRGLAHQGKQETFPEFRKRVNTVPFLRESFTEEELRLEYDLARPADDSILKPDDLKWIRDEAYLRKIEEEFQAKAKKEADAELQAQLHELEALRKGVERERDELSRVRSRLDTPPPEIALSDTATADPVVDSSETSWWQQLGLESDPFPTDRGLVGIPTEKYDQIVVQTPFFRKYVDAVTKAPDSLLGKTLVIAGEYGSGKTTLFSVVAHKLGTAGVLPLNVTLIPSSNVASLSLEFCRQVGDEICKVLRNSSGFDPRREIGPVDSLSKLGQILEFAVERGIGRQMLLLIDGLHKGNRFLNETFEFLQQLQNAQEYIEGKGIRVGVLVAGSKDWAKEFARTPSLSGSINRIDVIPPVGEDEAVEAAIRRILTFVPPGSPQPALRKESLRLAFRALAKRLSVVTFRNYLNDIRDRLVSRSFKEVGISVSLHAETIDLVQTFVRASAFRDNYLSLEKEIAGKSGIRRQLCALLPELYSLKGMDEGSARFGKVRSPMYYLKQHGFIRETRPKPEQVRWVISTELADLLKAVYDKHQVLPADTLAALYEEKSKTIEKEVKTIYTSTTRKYNEFMTKWTKGWPEIANEAKAVIGGLEHLEDSMGGNDPDRIDLSDVPHTLIQAFRVVLRSVGIQSERPTAVRLFQD